MMRLISPQNLRFIGKSLLWSLLLYSCVYTAFNWREVTVKITGETTQPEAYATVSPDLSPVKISIDSLQKQIHFADRAIKYVRFLTNIGH